MGGTEPQRTCTVTQTVGCEPKSLKTDLRQSQLITF